MEGKGHINLRISENESSAVITISDTGKGIPEQIQGSLFQSFVTLGKEHGTGLGLAVAREIVEAHGGTINFTSQSNTGTTFLISIPF